MTTLRLLERAGRLDPGARAVAPLLVALPGLYWAIVGSLRSTYAPLGRDPGIYQYVAWALSMGERDYVDVREINGPLIHVIHLAFLKLGGADEHVFRSLDFALGSVVFLAVGASLPGIAAPRGAEAPSRSLRLAWGLAGWVVLSANDLTYGMWSRGERESFYDLFLVASIALQLRAQWATVDDTRRRAWLVLGGALSALTWFGKPTYALFTIAQIAALALDRDAPDRKRGARALAVGAALGLVPMLAFLVVYGDAVAFVRIVFLETPRLYRFIWNKSIADCYGAYGDAPRLNYAFATLAAAAALVATGWLPRRFLLLVLFLVVSLVTFFGQGKGFPYHLHPITLATHLLWLASAAYAAERFACSGGRARGIVAVAGAALLGGWSMIESGRTEAITGTWYDDARASGPASEKLLRHFNRGDFFAWDLRQAASFLRARTQPTDRVQTYGMDPYLLFLAQRLSATPYIYNFELDVDAALEGGSGSRPDDAERAWLRSAAKHNEQSMLASLERRPPAAFALLDRAPFTWPEDADVDFAEHCPEAAAWMRARYRPAARFGAVRVWLRNDLGEKAE